VPEAQIESAVLQKVFDLSPGGIITTLDVLKPIYRSTDAYGHFGRSDRVGELWSEQISGVKVIGGLE